jgi:bla regulator protein blaR1
MILSLVFFLVVLSVLGSAAAFLLEVGLRRMGLSARLVWLAALAMGPVALLGSVSWPRAASRGLATVSQVVPVFELPAVAEAPAGGIGGSFVDEAALLIWALLGAALLFALIRAHRRLLRERAGWRPSKIQGVDVFLSVDRGPAVAGVMQSWIVVPEWVLSLSPAELRMVLLHENEHLLARDSALLATALALVALTVWNPMAWWQLRRLRLAMELDCDRRVLRRNPDRSVYGASLLAVAARASGPSFGLAFFSESSSSLQRRILAMTTKTTRWSGIGGVVLVALGIVVGVQACGVDGPFAPDPDPAQDAPSATVASPSLAEIRDEPTFTPFTVAPSITNRDEVVQALQDEYPPLLRDAGVEGTVRVYLLVDDEGTVQETRVDETSGHEALDAAALRVARAFRFRPALNRERPVPVWVSFPITFQTR